MTRRTAPVGRRPGTDEGSATVWTVAAVCLLCAVATAVISVAIVGLARRRASAAADLAALAAAAATPGDDAQRACARAARVAAAQQGPLLLCRWDGDTATVQVSVDLPEPLRRLGRLVARSRAGPARTVAGPAERHEGTQPGRPNVRTSAATCPQAPGGRCLSFASCD